MFCLRHATPCELCSEKLNSCAIYAMYIWCSCAPSTTPSSDISGSYVKPASLKLVRKCFTPIKYLLKYKSFLLYIAMGCKINLLEGIPILNLHSILCHYPVNSLQDLCLKHDDVSFYEVFIPLSSFILFSTLLFSVNVWGRLLRGT